MVPKLAAAAPGGDARCCGACARRSSCRSAATPACPAVLAARRLGVPIVVVSYDRRPGRASALTARFAAASAVAFPDSPLPRAVVTGAPVRRRILAVDRAARPRRRPRARSGCPPDRFVVAVTGGSQGSAALNAAVAGLRRRATRDDAALAVRQVVGDRFLAAVAAGRRRTGRRAPPGGRLRRPHRAGSTPPPTCSSGAAGRARSPRSPSPARRRSSCRGRARAEDHQTPNVRWLSDQGAAVLLPEAELARLGDAIDAPARRPGRLAALGDRGRARPASCTAAARSSSVDRAGRAPCPVARRPRPPSLDAPCRPAHHRSRPSPPSTSSRPLRLHVVGVGRAGDERRSPSPSPRWATPCPAATCASSRCSTGCGPPASPSTSVTIAGVVAGCDAVTSSTAIPDDATSSCARPASRASRRCAGPGCWRRSAPRPARSPSPARTARRRRRRC